MGRLMLAIGGLCLGVMGFVSQLVHNGVRDRVFAILILGVFVMFFWAAFEQAGNVLNIWADKHTNRYITQPAPEPSVKPEVIETSTGEQGEANGGRPGLLDRFRTMFVLKDTGKPAQGWGDWLTSSFNPVPTTWFQSINALAIFVIAPLFAWMWVVLDRRGLQPSIPAKMAIGLILMSASVAVMLGAAKQEDKASTVALPAGNLPPGIALTPDNKLAHPMKDGKLEPFQQGRLRLDSSSGDLLMTGVLSDNQRDLLIEKTAPDGFRQAVLKFQKDSQDIDHEKVNSVTLKLDPVPPGFDMSLAGIKRSHVRYNPEEGTLTAYEPLADKEVKGLLVAGGEPAFRGAVHKLFVESNAFVVSWQWLFWAYILATLGELCLSPVGLSMVSKLAPARFSTMLMGVWMLTSAFGNFAAGVLGEVWETMTPTDFFTLASAVVGVAAVVLLVLIRPIVRTMHGVN